MKQITIANFAAFFEKAEVGTSFSAQIFSITGGNVRVTCNWLYSALNIDPNDGSDFIWNLSKVDDSHVSLSPLQSCISKPVYASARDDYSWYLQVQAPFSADWITAVQRDEIIEMKIGDLMLTTFKGFNDKYIKREASPTSHGGHSGYKLQSTGNNEEDDTTWFLSIEKIAVKDHEWAGGRVSLDELNSALHNRKISLQPEELNALYKVMSK